MISYELAKKLKDAGYLDKYPTQWTSWCKDVGVHENLPSPTLSELIEACGDKFGYLASPQAEVNWGNDWLAVSGEKMFAFGSTPDEAVALLYLAIHAWREATQLDTASHPIGTPIKYGKTWRMVVYAAMCIISRDGAR